MGFTITVETTVAIKANGLLVSNSDASERWQLALESQIVQEKEVEDEMVIPGPNS